MDNDDFEDLSPEAAADYLLELLDKEDWAQAKNKLYSVNYFYPSRTADLLSNVFGNLPKHKESEDFVRIGMDIFVSHQQAHGPTATLWWSAENTYFDILSGLEEHDFDLQPYYVQICELFLNYAIFDELWEAENAVALCCHYLDDEHPMVEELEDWLSSHAEEE